MSKITVFVQVYGTSKIHELALAEALTVAELDAELKKHGIAVDEDTVIFVDDTVEHESREPHRPISSMKHGSRVHVSRCKKIEVTVNFVGQDAKHHFVPGQRVRAVKDWAVKHYHLAPKDAADHVLQIFKSSDRPASDTPLNQLVHDTCAICFDLVAEKRIEG